MTKPKHRYSKIIFGLFISFFSVAFINSSFFKIKEISYAGIDTFFERELKASLEKIKEKNLLFLTSNQINSKFSDFPFLEVESFQKILPDKLVLNFKIKEELGTYVTGFGSYDIYEGGFLFPRFRKTDEKIVIEGELSVEDLRFISDFVLKNKFIYDYFLSIKIVENNNINFLSKKGYWIEISRDYLNECLTKATKILDFCPFIFKEEKISMLNLNLFSVSNKEELWY